MNKRKISKICAIIGTSIERRFDMTLDEYYANVVKDLKSAESNVGRLKGLKFQAEMQYYFGDAIAFNHSGSDVNYNGWSLECKTGYRFSVDALKNCDFLIWSDDGSIEHAKVYDPTEILDDLRFLNCTQKTWSGKDHRKVEKCRDNMQTLIRTVFTCAKHRHTLEDFRKIYADLEKGAFGV